MILSCAIGGKRGSVRSGRAPKWRRRPQRSGRKERSPHLARHGLKRLNFCGEVNDHEQIELENHTVHWPQGYPSLY